jgi:transcriptional regulator with XRE-family HTH domain
MCIDTLALCYNRTMTSTLRATTATQIRAYRTRLGMSQQDLADRLNQLGARVDRTVVAKVESGKRAVSLEDAFRFALALHVAPVHLLVPTDSDEPIHLAPNLDAPPHEIRAWIRGFLPMLQDPRIYFSAVPRSEAKAAAEALIAWLETSPTEVSTHAGESES